MGAPTARQDDFERFTVSLAPGTRIGPYEITGQIGAGGMGEVYKARDTRLDRTEAEACSPGVDRTRRVAI